MDNQNPKRSAGFSALLSISEPDCSPRQLWGIYGFIFLLSLLVRLLYLFEIKDTHIFFALMGDGELYDLWAQKISQGDWLGDQVFFQAPFYPYFLGIIYAIFGHNLLVLRLIQILLGAIACVLLASAGSAFFSRRIGWTTGLLMAIYPVAIFYDGLVQKAGLGLVFTALLLFLLGKALDRPNTLIWVLTGIVCGCFILVRENILIFTMVIIGWIWFYFNRYTVKQRAIWCATVILGTALVLSPVALRNKIIGGELALTTSNFGYNLFVGNNIDSSGTYSPLVWGQGDWRFELSDANRLAESAVGRSLTPAEVSNYWAQKAITDITSHPIEWLRLITKKWLLLWNDTEISDTESIYAYMDWSAVLHIIGSVFSFGILCPFAILGICLTWPLRRRVWLLYALLLSYAASISLFFVFARYRQPMTAILVMFAAAGIVQGLILLAEKRYKQLVFGTGIALAAAIVVNWNIYSEEVNAANTYYNWATIFESKEEFADAARFYDKAIELNPKHSMAHSNLGIVLFRQGRPNEAIDHFRQAVKLNPGIAQMQNNLGIALLSEGYLAEALTQFETVLRLDPDFGAHVHYNIACIYSRQNRVDQSLAWLSEAIEKGYSNWDAIYQDPDLANSRSSPYFQTFLEFHGQPRQNGN